MGYVEDNLSKGETVVYRARVHWVVLVKPLLLSLLVVGIPWLIAAILRRSTAEFAVTSKQVIVKYGLITRRTLELHLAKIESIGVDQTLWGRMLGFGTITIIGTGGTREPFPAIADPLGFRRAVNDATTALPAAAPPR